MKNDDYMKERYIFLKQSHRCVSCTKKDNRTLSGRVFCQTCSEKAKKYPSNIKKSEQLKKKRDERKAAGLCVNCGAERDSKFKLCEKCREYYRKYNKQGGTKENNGQWIETNI